MSSTPIDQPVQFADNVAYEDKTKPREFTVADVNREITDHDADCLVILGFRSIAELTAAYAIQFNNLNGVRVKNRGLEAALSERRHHQSLHKELRDEWAMHVYAHGGRDLLACYAEADRAIDARQGK